MRILLREGRRLLLGLAFGVLAFIAVAATRAQWDTALLVGWDVGVLAWLILVFLMMGRVDAQSTSAQAQAQEPATWFTLAVVIVTSVVGLLGAVALSARTTGRGQLAQTLHFAGGAFAVVEAWLLLHTEFALYYARLHYDEVVPAPVARDSRTNDSALVPFRKGLEFPDLEVVDYWDFMYYAYTIAMCYQTSDVTVKTSQMRRVTLLHAVLSFAFVLVILSFAVNAVGTVL